MYYTPTPPSPSMSHHTCPVHHKPPVPSARPVARPLSAPEHSAAPESAVRETDAESVSGASSGAGDDGEGATNSGKHGMVRALQLGWFLDPSMFVTARLYTGMHAL